MAGKRSQERTAQEIIDQAIAENRHGEVLLYVLATLAALVGLSVLVSAVLKSEPILAVAGTACTSLFWPAMRLARQTRKENIALRMLEAPLSRATTAEEAASMLRTVFLSTFQVSRGTESSLPGQPTTA